MELKFTLPGLPKMTNPSGAKSTHWRVIKAERDLWMVSVCNMVKYLGKIGVPLPESPLKKARLTLTRHSSVSPDPDGLVSGFKAIVDGLVLAGVLENDRFSNIGMPDYRWVKAKKGEGMVTILVEWEISND